MHKNSHSKMEWFKNNYLNVKTNLSILDVGSLDTTGTYNYSDIFRESQWKYTGLDFEAGHNVNIVVKDIYNWTEIKNNSYDVIISGQFFDHLEFYWKTLNQINRVLKPGGYLCIIVPSAGPHHGGDLPNCCSFKEDGLKAMAKYINLEVLHVSIDNREEVKPWYDACLVAQKPKPTIIDKRDKLEIKMSNLEAQMNEFLENI